MDPALDEGDQLATFAAGCFWSVELVYQRTLGVKHTAVGYIGGTASNPTYFQESNSFSELRDCTKGLFLYSRTGLFWIYWACRGSPNGIQ